MFWDGDNDLFRFYKETIRLRKENSALARGDYKTILADDRLFVFRRFYGSNTVTIAMNAGETPAVYDGKEIGPLGYMIQG
jgi:glycosidase